MTIEVTGSGSSPSSSLTTTSKDKDKEKDKLQGLFSTFLNTPGAAGVEEDAESAGTQAKDEFLAFVNLSPAEKMRYSYLASKGLDEASLAALPADEREKIEAEIREMIKAQFEENTTGTPIAAATATTTATATAGQAVIALQEKAPSVDVNKSLLAYTSNPTAAEVADEPAEREQHSLLS
ncbi:hypothetical protein CKO38_16395 [Rhodospirillum rubrum]|uniref:hypothetical protein n=1 Tax=Rhodospirillum rubrum TaxID=1085 RepID=UPI0019075F9C|nr:hypothetical protein [Rhodospirillum rubrum]MBK1665827.1 hypothetical protein [Rhodospirillum rubrum]MBK1678222.1 hypothetical protein [Rhodospirillum rubrum]